MGVCFSTRIVILIGERKMLDTLKNVLINVALTKDDIFRRDQNLPLLEIKTVQELEEYVERCEKRKENKSETK